MAQGAGFSMVHENLPRQGKTLSFVLAIKEETDRK